KVVPYEEMDNNYASRAHETYTRYVTTWERIVDGIIDFSQMVGNFVDGVIKSVEDLIKGLVGLVIGVSVYAVGAVAVAITKVTGDTPDWLKGAEEDFYKDNEMIKAVLDDPSIIVEGIAQQVSDAKDEKGLVYCTGYTAGLIAQMVLLKKVKGGSGAEEVKDFYRKNPADPIRDVLGSGLKSNPAEWNKLINAMKDNGVEIVYRDGTMAYSPGLVPGAPGQLIIDKNASMSALIHEYQHYLDDLASGLPGMRQLYEQNPRVIKELRAYMKEIKIADELGLKDVSSQLWENYRQERESILNLFKE
ncbi:hypothetical protein, partial [Clostridium sp. HBUAS56017]|uniref:hypothetical protein n=1 Tax=Clostridium sp. HBUAS56017 TaxID=2571128 RepID=UPI001A9AE966